MHVSLFVFHHEGFDEGVCFESRPDPLIVPLIDNEHGPGGSETSEIALSDRLRMRRDGITDRTFAQRTKS